jgi:AraC-like DNA-binding protein
MAGKLILSVSLQAVWDDHSSTQTTQCKSLRLSVISPYEVCNRDSRTSHSHCLTFDFAAHQLDSPLQEISPSCLSREKILLLRELLAKVNSDFRLTEHPLAIGHLTTCDSRVNPSIQLPPWLEEVRKILNAEFAERPKLYEIAAKVGVHPVHLARQFRKYFGSSVKEYVRKLRVDFACQQLLASDAPPAQIASAAGFADQSHFSRTFKRVHGMTPGRYRALRAVVTMRE